MTSVVLEISGLAARYGQRSVFDNISLSIEAGQWFTLLGPNGCGKSTLIDCVVGRLTPAAGDVRVSGFSLPKDPYNAKRHLGYACAPDTLPGLLTARQCLEVHAGAKGIGAIDADVMTLVDQFNFVPYLDCFVDTLSLGTRQKLAILLSLIGEPRLIVLDESFNGLDPASSLVFKRYLVRRLRERRSGLLLATHALDLVQKYSDRAGLLVDGGIIRQWDQLQLSAQHNTSSDFESELAATMQSHYSKKK